MIWLTWRQHRAQVGYLLLGLLVTVAALVPLGRSMHKSYEQGLAPCLRAGGSPEFIRPGDASECHELAERFTTNYGYLIPLTILLVILPLLAGLFLGAPLVAREVEQGTHRLVWTQGVSRLRWATTKFGLLGAAGLALGLGYTVFLSWWIEPLNVAAGSRLEWLIFDLQGAVPVGYTAFALALGTAAGVLSRKLLPAMGITLAAFVVSRVLVAWLARPHYQAAVERKISVVTDQVPNHMRGDWLISAGVYDAAGNRLSDGGTYCPAEPRPQMPAEMQDRCNPSNYNLEVFQPAGRFWTFQWIETGIFAGLAAALLAYAVYGVRRRIA
jgi:hypothetical protein